MSTTAEIGQEFLEHYGVKGMRWGIRKDADLGHDFLVHYGVLGMKWGVRNQRSAQEVSAQPKTTLRGKTKIKTSGGEAQPATEDALKAAIAHRTLRKSGPAALSNKELKDLANRMQLEQQVSDLTRKRSPAATKFVKEELGRSTRQTVSELTTQAIKTGVKQGVKSATKR